MRSSMTERGSGGMSLFSSIESSEGFKLRILIRACLLEVRRRDKDRDSLLRISIRVDDEGLTDDLSGNLPPGNSEKRVVARLMREHGGEVRPSGLPADEKALSEIRLQKRGVLNNLRCARNIG